MVGVHSAPKYLEHDGACPSKAQRFLNPKVTFTASHLQSITMKTLFIVCFCSIALALGVFAQSPGTSPALSPAQATSASPGSAASPTPTDGDDLGQRIEKKMKRHFNMTIDGHEPGADDEGDMGALMAIPIVGIVFTTLFGAPVLIVAVIMFMNYLKARSLHRTVRTMVEKGQPVPAALFLPQAQRVRSDLRRGIVLITVGLGLAVCLAALDPGDASWSLGVIPFLIGVGYLIVWKLEGKKDNPPPVP